MVMLRGTSTALDIACCFGLGGWGGSLFTLASSAARPFFAAVLAVGIPVLVATCLVCHCCTFLAPLASATLCNQTLTAMDTIAKDPA